MTFISLYHTIFYTALLYTTKPTKSCVHASLIFKCILTKPFVLHPPPCPLLAIPIECMGKISVILPQHVYTPLLNRRFGLGKSKTCNLKENFFFNRAFCTNSKDIFQKGGLIVPNEPPPPTWYTPVCAAPFSLYITKHIMPILMIFHHTAVPSVNPTCHPDEVSKWVPV